MLSLVTVSPVITAFYSCCLSHHVFDQVNLWPAWVGIETAIFWQSSPGTVETQRLYPLRHGPRRSPLITWRKPEVKFCRNVVKKKQRKNYQDEDKKSAINEKLILIYIYIYIITQIYRHTHTYTQKHTHSYIYIYI